MIDRFLWAGGVLGVALTVASCLGAAVVLATETIPGYRGETAALVCSLVVVIIGTAFALGSRGGPVSTSYW
jgi:hypothetical protein